MMKNPNSKQLHALPCSMEVKNRRGETGVT